jgi:hypothetical protein
MRQHGLAIEHWNWERKHSVRMWLVNNFGVSGGRWGEQLDYGLENLWMDEDVYLMYTLKWK